MINVKVEKSLEFERNTDSVVISIKSEFSGDIEVVMLKGKETE